MARVKQTAKKPNRQAGIAKAVKEYTCFICQWTTEWVPNLRRHLARLHKLREDGTAASPSYCDKYANKRSKKWQMEHAIANDGDCADVGFCAPPVAKKPKWKNVCRVGHANETGLMDVGETHSIPLSCKIGTAHKRAYVSACDATKASGGMAPMLAHVTVPAHSATLSLPATDIETHAYDNIELLLTDELRSQEDALAVHSLFDTGLTDPGLFVMNQISDIPLGLGWGWDSPVDTVDGNADVVQLSDRTAKAGAKVDPVITKALKTKGARGVTTPQCIVSSILSTLIDDVVYASPEALVGSILEDLVAKAVPRPLPPPTKNKKAVKGNAKTIDPGTKCDSAASVEVTSCANSNGKKVATKSNGKKNTNAVGDEDKVQSDDALVSVRFGKGPRVAHVPLHVVGDDPTVRKPCVNKNPAPKAKAKPHVAGVVGALSVSVVDTKSATVSNENVSSRRKVATKSNKNVDIKDARQNVVNDSVNVNVAHESEVQRMHVTKTPSKFARAAHNVDTTPSKTSAMRADASFLAPVARVVQSPPVASRKYLPRKTVAKYAWKLDRSTADVAVMLKDAYGLTSPEQSRMVDRVSDMRCAFKHMTARMHEQCGLDMVTEADRVALYHKLEKHLKFVEMYDDEDDA